MPTTIQPPCIWLAPVSVPVTVKWQKPGVFPALMVIVPGCIGVIVGLVKVIVPPHAVIPSKLSNAADPNVTFAVPLVIFGCKVTVPLAATIIVSGFKSHSEAGVLAVLPEICSKVALYRAKVIIDVHAGVALVIVVGAAAASV